MAFVCAGTLYCLVTYFSERQRIPTQQTKKVSAKRAAIDDVANSMTMCGMLTVYDGCILGCMLLNIATKGSIASFETLGISYAGTHFGLPSQQAGVLVATCGSVGVIALLSMGTFAKYFSDIQLICGGMAVMAVGIISLTGFNELEDEGIENPKWRYFLAIFMIYSVGYPIGHTAVIGMFSKSKLRCIVQSHKENHVCVQDLTLCFFQLLEEDRKDSCLGISRLLVRCLEFFSQSCRASLRTLRILWLCSLFWSLFWL